MADAEQAAELLPGLLRAGDTVLVKGSRGVGLERVAQRLAGGVGASGAAGSPEAAGLARSSTPAGDR